MTSTHLQKRIDAAQGRIVCDLQIRDVTYLDVFTGEWRRGEISIIDGSIVALESGLKAERVIDGRGKFCVPGFIDAHVHLESSLCLPQNFERAVLPCGTTSAICDPHELANVLGVDGIRYFLEAAENLNLNLQVMLSSCVPATAFETNGGGHLTASDLVPLLNHPKALGLAEMMNFPGVLQKDPEVLDKLVAFSGRRIDGHCPKLSGLALSAYAASGISSCHESTELEEAREKLTKGMAVWIREGSVAKDLAALIPLLTPLSSPFIGFCTDDRNPLDIANEGHVDYLVRTAIAMGISPALAYRSASWSVARHYQLEKLGAIAPGFCADLILLDDFKTCAIAKVIKSGTPVDELSEVAMPTRRPQNSIRADIPLSAAFEGPTGRVHVVEVEAGSIITGRSVANHSDAGVARLTVVERHGHGGAPANAYVRGFGAKFRGAIASSVGHDSHNLIVVGHHASDMQVAVSALKDSGGGFAVVSGGSVQAHLPLPFAGLMSNSSASEIKPVLEKLREASLAVGCELPEPFLQLAFLSLPVIPSLKLTDKGLFDVDSFRLIDVRA